MNFAAQVGDIKLMIFLHKLGAKWNEDTCVYAALNGNLECLKYLHENGCPWNEETCEYAALGNQLECLKYAHINGCPMNNRALDNAWGETFAYLETNCDFIGDDGIPLVILNKQI